MKCIKVNLDKHTPYINLYTFSDLHIGDSNCNYSLINKMIERVKSDKYAYAIINGDLMNNVLVSSVGDIYTEQLPPMEQLNKCIELFKPIADKIICINTGNHERRTSKTTGIELMRVFASELNKVDCYTDTSGVIFITFDNKKYKNPCYSIYVTHGSGGGKRPGSKLNKLEDLSKIIDCDVYIHSHTHLPACMKQDFIRCSHNNKGIKQIERLYVNTNSFLDYGGYGEVCTYTPSNKTMPVITFNGYKKEMKCEV